MKKIQIVGSIGSGKSSLARVLSQKLDMNYLELDDLFWFPGWKIRPLPEFIKIVSKETKKQEWMICGNYYSLLKEVVFDQADTIVWLNYPFRVCFWQCFKRAIHNITKQEPCCNGNHETWGRLFFSKSSILLWLLRTFRRRNKRYEQLMQDPLYKDKKFVKLNSHQEAKSWIDNLVVKTK